MAHAAIILMVAGVHLGGGARVLRDVEQLCVLLEVVPNYVAHLFDACTANVLVLV